MLELGKVTTDNSYQIVPIANSVYDILLEQKELITNMKDSLGIKYKDCGFVFPTETGGSLDFKNYKPTLEKYLQN